MPGVSKRRGYSVIILLNDCPGFFLIHSAHFTAVFSMKLATCAAGVMLCFSHSTMLVKFSDDRSDYIKVQKLYIYQYNCTRQRNAISLKKKYNRNSNWNPKYKSNWILQEIQPTFQLDLIGYWANLQLEFPSNPIGIKECNPGLFKVNI